MSHCSLKYANRQPDNWLSALAEPFVTVLAHGNGVSGRAIFSASLCDFALSTDANSPSVTTHHAESDAQ